MASGAREPISDLLLVRRMNVPAIAEIDRDREAGIAILLDCTTLRFAHARPTALDRLRRRLTEVRELHDQERYIAAEAAAPIGHPMTQQRFVLVRLLGIGFALVPHDAAHGVVLERRDHRIADHGQSRRDIPRRARRLADRARHDLVFPFAVERDGSAVGELELTRGVAPRAAAAPKIERVHDDRVRTGFQHALRQVVDAIRIGTRGAAHGPTVHPRDVDVVDFCERQPSLLLRLLRAQLDACAQPHHPIEIFERGHSPLFPMAELARRERPFAFFCTGPRLRRADAGVPPPLPDITPAPDRDIGLGCSELENLEHVFEAAGGAQRLGAHPGLDTRPTPRRVDQAHWHIHLLLQFTRKVEARRRELSEGLRRRRLPANGLRERVSRCCARIARDSEEANGIVRGACALAPEIERAARLHLHVRLTRAQPYIADQHIGDRLVCAGLRARRERERSAGRHCRKLHAPRPRRVAAS